MSNRSLLFILIFYAFYKYIFLELPKDTAINKVEFLNIGQGDAIKLTTKNKKVILIDSGPSNDISLFFSDKPCFIDTIFITHLHHDHYNGLNRLLKYCFVSQVYINLLDNVSAHAYGQLLVNLKDTRVYPIFSNQKIIIDGLSFYVLWPDKDRLDKTSKNLNLLSTVLLVDIGNYEILLTGDAEKEILDDLDLGILNSIIQLPLEIYKVPHQGSRDAVSYKLLNKLKPKNAVISVGANSYGHPHVEAISALESIGASIFRTDVLDTITFNF